MDHLSFFPFHNRHIEFFYDGEKKARSGVVVDSIPYDKKEYSTQYVFIETKKMRDWKAAENKNDASTMRRLEDPIDILKIENPILLPY